MATGKKGRMTCTYVVGRYRPAGNMGGEYKKKVPKGSFTTALCSKLDKMVKEIEASAASGGKGGGGSDAKPGQGGAESGAGDTESSPPGKAAAPTAGNAPEGGGALGTSFQKGGLAAHNKFRKIHGTSSMKLNKKMCDEAHAYAKVLAQKGSLQHADSKDGENLAYGCSSGPDAGLSGAEATKRW